MLENAVKAVIKGIMVNSFTIYAKRSFKGRFREEVNLDVYIRSNKGGEEAFLLYVKVFYGRKPYFRPWVEFFEINSVIRLNEWAFEYFDSIFEDTLLSNFSKAIGPGGFIYVEYYNDEETKRQLDADLPIVVSRLGYKLFRLGFTGFKNWYFPEGFMEGGVKLQGEMAISDEVRDRQLKDIYNELKTFLNRMKDLEVNKSYIAKAIERAKIILDQMNTS
ncbi:MAG: DUF1122 family protein [Nitrososphaerota archaeon]|nr:DUF1122 family protein [Nitrososphaerales archaeon]MDW8044940.1 DUF1122 family protein [Nitrososphaerota archaeon]